jgi:hypothetical protein
MQLTKLYYGGIDMLEINTKIVMLRDHLWNPNPFCSAYAHEGESGYIKEVKDKVYVVMLNSKWNPNKPNEYRDHEIEIEIANKYFKEIKE